MTFTEKNITIIALLTASIVSFAAGFFIGQQRTINEFKAQESAMTDRITGDVISRLRQLSEDNHTGDGVGTHKFFEQSK